MKAVILAGGFGTRLSEETTVKPKPMIEIGEKPILWHIMKIYSQHGINDFIICCGYKGFMIKEFFLNYFPHTSDITIDLAYYKVEYHRKRSEDWRVTLVDTGEDSMTGGRLRAVKQYLDPNEPFCFTYGDGLTDQDISATIAFHKAHGKLATVTASFPPGRFGAMEMDGNSVQHFKEKPAGDGGMINAGYFVLQPEVLDYIEGPSTIWEQDPLNRLAAEGQLQAYRHDGFWHPMDTLRDMRYLNSLWNEGRAAWKKW